MAARRVAVIANTTRPGVEATLRALAPALHSPRVAVLRTRDLGEARRAIHQGVSAGHEVFLFTGGDGTLTMGLTLLAEACRTRPHPAIGVLPMGTGNAFAHSYGISPGLAEARAQLARAADPGHPLRRFRPLQAAGVRAPFCGVGIDARIIADHSAASAQLDRLGSASRLLGKRARYALALATRSLPRLIFQGRPHIQIHNLGAPAQRIDLHGQEAGPPLPAGALLWEGECTMAAAATIPCFGFGLRMFQYAQRRGDRFHLRASDAGMLEIARNTRAAFAGRYTSPHVHDFLADRVELRLRPAAPFEAGGEDLGQVDTVELALGPELSVVAP